MILTLGSFATVWMSLWFCFAVVLILAYPVLRKPLFRLRPAFASTLLFGLMSVPLLFSLLCTALLFIPTVENLLVRDHCHTNCGTHIPLVNSPYFAWPGFCILSLFTTYFTLKIYQQLRFAKGLNQQLTTISESDHKNDYRLLADTRPLVFTVGWWRNTVYISEGIRAACSQRELDIICAHERAHIERKDNLRIMATRLLTLLIPPRFIYQLREDLQLLIESACDAKAASRYGTFSVAETFVKVQRLMPTVRNLPYGVSAINGSPIEHRVKTLLDYDDLYQPPRSLVITITGVVLAGFLLA